MDPATWGALAASVLQAGGALYAGNKAAKANEKAAAMAQMTGAQNNALARQQYAHSFQQMSPWMQSGANALNQINALHGLAQVDTSHVGQLDPSLASANGVPEGAKPLTVDGVAVQYAAPGQPGTRSQRAPAYYTDDGKIYAEGVGYVGTAQPGQDIPFLVRGNDNTVALDAQGRFTDSGNNVQGRAFGPSINPNRTAGQGFDESQNGGMVAGTGGNGTGNAFQNAVATFRNTPGYQFALQEGVNAIDKSGAARGNLLSGATVRALSRYASGLADQTYNNYTNRLMSLAGYGANAAGSANSQGNALTQAMMQNNNNVTNGAGTAMMMAANSRGSAVKDALGAIGGGISAFFKPDDPQSPATPGWGDPLSGTSFGGSGGYGKVGTPGAINSTDDLWYGKGTG